MQRQTFPRFHNKKNIATNPTGETRQGAQGPQEKSIDDVPREYLCMAVMCPWEVPDSQRLGNRGVPTCSVRDQKHLRVRQILHPEEIHRQSSCSGHQRGQGTFIVLHGIGEVPSQSYSHSTQQHTLNAADSQTTQSHNKIILATPAWTADQNEVF